MEDRNGFYNSGIVNETKRIEDVTVRIEDDERDITLMLDEDEESFDQQEGYLSDEERIMNNNARQSIQENKFKKFVIRN